MGNLTKSRDVLEFLHGEGDEITFVHKGDEPSISHLNRQNIPRDMWEDLGRPETITVSIEPGDKLQEA
jgi:hypothetical protein